MCIKVNKDGSVVINWKKFKTNAIIGSSTVVVALGILWGAAGKMKALAQDNCVKPAVKCIAESTFVEMHRPYEKRLNDQAYDTKLIRLLVESLVTDSAKSVAIKQMNDTTWRTR